MMSLRLRYLCYASCAVIVAHLMSRARHPDPPILSPIPPPGPGVEPSGPCTISNGTFTGKLASMKGVPDHTRRRAIVQMTSDAWCAYRTYAWGADDLRPLSMTGVNWVHLSLTAATSIDTLLIMGMRTEAAEASAMLIHRLTNRTDAMSPMFDTVARVLAGVISAYSITSDVALLQSGIALANDASFAFDSKTGIPASGINLATKQSYVIGTDISTTSYVALSDAGTSRMEYDAVSHAMGTPQYRRV